MTGEQAILGITRALQKCDLTIAVLGRKSLFFLNCSKWNSDNEKVDKGALVLKLLFWMSEIKEIHERCFANVCLRGIVSPEQVQNIIVGKSS